MLVTKSGKRVSIPVFVEGRNTDTTHWSLELDKRVCVVVLVARVRFAALAEVRVVADSALVADALNVWQVLAVFAERPIAVDAVVASWGSKRLWQRLIYGDEAVTRVDDLGALRALRAVIPVRAVQALVADTIDELVAAIADGRVASVPAWCAESMSQGR
jgi:hypothetical protein